MMMVMFIIKVVLVELILHGNNKQKNFRGEAITFNVNVLSCTICFALIMHMTVMMIIVVARMTVQICHCVTNISSKTHDSQPLHTNAYQNTQCACINIIWSRLNALSVTFDFFGESDWGSDWTKIDNVTLYYSIIILYNLGAKPNFLIWDDKE